MKAIERLKQKRMQFEGHIIGTIYKNPDKAFELEIGNEFFVTYEVFHSIFLSMMSKGIKKITKQEIRRVLEENPYLQDDFQAVGGLEMLGKLQSDNLTAEENLEVYEQGLVKAELLIRLREANLITDAEIKTFARYSIEKIQQEIELKHVSLFAGMPSRTKVVSITEGIRENIKDADEGNRIGLQFLCPHFSERTFGRILGNINILAMSTGGGKSFATTVFNTIANIKMKEPLLIVANEESLQKHQDAIIVHFINNVIDLKGRAPIGRKRLKKGKFQPGENEIIDEAITMLEELNKDGIIKFVDMSAYTTAEAKIIIRKAALEGTKYFQIDTFKADYDLPASHPQWQALDAAALALYREAKELHIHITLTVQIAGATARQKYLDFSNLSGAKSMAVTASLLTLWRPVWEEEKSGNSMLNIWDPLNLPIQLDPDKEYRICFFGKNREGEVSPQMVYEFMFDTMSVEFVGHTIISQE